ncbi:hypothetical protein V7S43_009983 [Phytophthora oleae]|uniref:ABC transporter domain-containing protein n=1 Tax=Phytophthora oleae TaxID=2107226 RepID=A0ABD3FCY2_9STRA
MATAFGDHFPTMELRFKNVSVSADVVVKDTSDAKTEIPTLPNVVMKTIRGQVATKYKVKKQILDNVSGVFKPGTMTLVLGQPGSGKSALMKLLSGRFPKDSNVVITGEVTYNGTPLPKLPKETLEFAHACSGGDLAKYWEKSIVHGTPEENQKALKVVRAMYQHYPEVVIQQLGLDTCQNTIVGDAMERGVSGGERKRVTTGEMAFGNAYVKMMDEISTGLDSAAAFDILTMQRSIAKKFHKTVVISLLQPSPEMFALFDNVILLNEGRVMYNGPCDEALDYFEALGFKRLPHRDVADFLIDLGTNKQVQHQVRNNASRSPQEFGEAFENSSAYERLQAEFDVPDAVRDMERIMEIQPEFYQSFGASTILLMKRQITMMRREMSGLVGRLMMNTLLALLYGCVFYQIDPSDPQLVMGIIFEAALCLSMALSAQIPSIMAARDVFYKQRGANFFRTASYILSSIVYWMCGFVSSVGSFALFVAMLCLVNFTFASFVFFLASAAPNINVVNPIAGVAIEMFILFAGFTITKDQIPDYLIWIYWINPVDWGVRALAVNQYTEARFDTCIYDDIDYCARYGMKMGVTSYEVPSQRYWIWYGMLYTVGAYFVFSFLSFIALDTTDTRVRRTW